MSTLKVDGDWITLDGHRVARLVDDLPHWLLQDLREHEGSPDEWVDVVRDAKEKAFSDGYAEAERDAEAETESRRKEYGDD